MSASVMGQGVKSPGWSCRWFLASVRGQIELPHHTVRGSGEPIFPAPSASSGCGRCGFTIFTVPAVELRVGLAGDPVS